MRTNLLRLSYPGLKYYSIKQHNSRGDAWGGELSDHDRRRGRSEDDGHRCVPFFLQAEYKSDLKHHVCIG